MNTDIDIKKIHDSIEQIRLAAVDLKIEADNFPAVARNAARILANVKMLEIGVSDIIEY